MEAGMGRENGSTERSSLMAHEHMGSEDRVQYPVTLSFDRLTYEIPPTPWQRVQGSGLLRAIGSAVPLPRTCAPMAAAPQRLLQDVSGYLRPGTVLAIMGPSGAGKTTLLDNLAFRANRGTLVHGTRKVNGEHVDMRLLQRISGYVMQDDSLMGALTVKESLMFAANLKLPELRASEREVRVNTILQQLSLWKVRDRMIGTQFTRGVSGGERRRVSIGIELISAPSILFLDEPTSGLDGNSAYTVMKTIIDLSKTGCSMICTIHQPRSNIYALFDDLLLLSAGRTVYYGPASDAVSYFNSLGYECDHFTNPADWMLDVISENQKLIRARANGMITSTVDGEEIAGADVTGGDDEWEDGELERLIREHGTLDLVEHFRDCALSKELNACVQAGPALNADEVAKMEEMKRLDRYSSPAWWQLVVQVARNLRNALRNPAVIWVRLLQGCIMALLMGSIFFQVGTDLSSVQPRSSALFFICTFQVLSSFPSLPLLLEERGRFNRERMGNMYSTPSYFSASFISQLPFLLVFSCAFGTISYWMVGLQADAGKFFFFLVAITLLSLVGDALCKMVGALVSTFSIANAIASLVITFFMLFSGFFVQTEQLPAFWQWAPYLSLFKYSFEAIMINEYTGLELCGEIADVDGSICVEGQKILSEFLDIDASQNVWLDVLVLGVIWIVFRAFTLIFLLFLNKEKR